MAYVMLAITARVVGYYVHKHEIMSNNVGLKS